MDEAGRGALAGPLVAAAVILDEACEIEGLNDSKLLAPSKRELLYGEITAKALAWSVARIDHLDIDERGLQWANRTALETAISSLEVKPDFVLSDAVPLNDLSLPRLAVVKGDRLSASIAAASIIAKVTRDRIMLEYHAIYPAYRFDEHKGYATRDHKSLLAEHGPCPIHRRCFAPISDWA